MLRMLLVGAVGILVGAAMVGHAEDPTGGGKSCKKWGVTSKWANGPDWSVDFSGAEPFAVATIGTSTRVFARICGD